MFKYSNLYQHGNADSGLVPDLGERFDLAKALVTTVFNIHNIGWVHKNIQSKNILFWPKADSSNEPDLSKPYLMGFDISRPNQPGEVSEKPLSHFEDGTYISELLLLVWH